MRQQCPNEPLIVQTLIRIVQVHHPHERVYARLDSSIVVPLIRIPIFYQIRIILVFVFLIQQHGIELDRAFLPWTFPGSCRSRPRGLWQDRRRCLPLAEEIVSSLGISAFGLTNYQHLSCIFAYHSTFWPSMMKSYFHRRQYVRRTHRYCDNAQWKTINGTSFVSSTNLSTSLENSPDGMLIAPLMFPPW